MRRDSFLAPPKRPDSAADPLCCDSDAQCDSGFCDTENARDCAAGRCSDVASVSPFAGLPILPPTDVAPLFYVGVGACVGTTFVKIMKR